MRQSLVKVPRSKWKVTYRRLQHEKCQTRTHHQLYMSLWVVFRCIAVTATAQSSTNTTESYTKKNAATREYRTGIAWRYWVLSRQQNPNKEAAVSLASHVRMLQHQWLQPSPAVANHANVDVHYIAHLGSWLPYYITDYVTKHKQSEQDEMRQDTFTWSKSLASNTLLFMLRSVKNRQVGAVEAADRLLGHELFSN